MSRSGSCESLFSSQGSVVFLDPSRLFSLTGEDLVAIMSVYSQSWSYHYTCWRSHLSEPGDIHDACRATALRQTSAHNTPLMMISNQRLCVRANAGLNTTSLYAANSQSSSKINSQKGKLYFFDSRFSLGTELSASALSPHTLKPFGINS